MKKTAAGQVPVILSADQLPEWLHRYLPRTARLTADSRLVRSGDAFFALQGARHDGAAFVAQAIEAGAAAIVLDAAHPLPSTLTAGPVPVCRVPALRQALGMIAATWHEQPSAGFHLVAVTGTNGKTSITHWIADGCNAALAAERAVVVGTNGEGVPGALRPIGMTTPDALSIQGLFRRYADAGRQVVAIEASSIGLEQGRLAGSAIRTAVFSNLSRDHLDYHGSMEAYAAAKLALFDWPGIEHAVINLDDALAPALLAAAGRNPSAPRCIGYLVHEDGADEAAHGRDPDTGMPLALQQALARADACDEVLMAVATEPGRWVLNLLQAPAEVQTSAEVPVPAAEAVQQSSIELDLQVIGRFNLANTLAVAGVWRAMGWSLAQIAEQLAALQPVPGRMERIVVPAARQAESGALPLVVVDYAHTPDALENVLVALRELARQRAGALWCVFGAGGNRDRGKRPHMAAVAGRLADRVVLTSDNPRDEDPAAILADVAAGLSAPAWLSLADRREAIARVVAAASPEDVVLVAGKGRETTQEIAGVFHPFSDPAVVTEALLQRLDRVQLAGDQDA